MGNFQHQGFIALIQRDPGSRHVFAAKNTDRAFPVALADAAAETLAIKEALRRRKKCDEFVVVAGLEFARIAKFVVDLEPGVPGTGVGELLEMVLDRCVVVERQEMHRPKQNLAQMFDNRARNRRTRTCRVILHRGVHDGSSCRLVREFSPADPLRQHLCDHCGRIAIVIFSSSAQWD